MIESIDKMSFDMIDVVFYINLAHRTDRREHIESEFKRVGISDAKVHRIDAIKCTPGTLGCIKSHIKTLETFLANPAHKIALILEDDFTFKTDDLNKPLNVLFTNFPDWDVVNLAYHPERLTYLDTSIPSIKKVLFALTTSGFLVHRNFAQRLLNNWREVERLHELLGSHGHTSLDVSWISLQPQSNWYLFWPALGNQCGGYSDIMNEHTEHGW